MKKYDWRFPDLDGGPVQGLNDSGIATFEGSDLYINLAREICQNSLDATDDETKPVIVRFNKQKIHKDKFYAILELESIFKRCKDYKKIFFESKTNTKLISFFSEAEKVFACPTINLLVISDYNTRGLEGSKKEEDGPWNGLTSSIGESYKRAGSGGSYGIGKNAPFACTPLRTVFYNTYAKDEVKAFLGSVILFTHIEKNREGKSYKTQGRGMFQNTEKRCPIYEKDKCDFKDYFNRNEYGTDIIIVGFQEKSDYKNQIICAIIKNFLVSIIENKLEVEVEGVVINKNTINNLIDDISKTNEDIEFQRIKYYYETYFNPDHFARGNILENEDVEIFIKKGGNYTRTTAEIRGTGMLIRILPRKRMMSYESILIIKGKELNERLRQMEPPKHDRWDSGILGNEEEQKQGRKLIDKINKFAREAIDLLCITSDVDEIDPDGISEFLPDDIYEIPKGSKHKKSNYSGEVVVGGVKTKPITISNISASGAEGLGTPTEGKAHNETSGGNKSGTRPPGSGEPGDEKVKNPTKDGKYKLNILSVKTQRVIPINYDIGVYKVIVVSSEDTENVFFRFKVVGDDNSHEEIQVKRIIMSGQIKKLNSPIAGPFILKKDEKLIFVVVLDFNERAQIEIEAAV